jgi:hypothetical protein
LCLVPFIEDKVDGVKGIQIAPGIMISFNLHTIILLGDLIDRHRSLKKQNNTMMAKSHRTAARVRSLQAMFGLSPETVGKIPGTAIQAVTLYGEEL